MSDPGHCRRQSRGKALGAFPIPLEQVQRRALGRPGPHARKTAQSGHEFAE
jgi:hypothetical protein